MSRHRPPDHTEAAAVAGLRRRRERQGQPVGGQYCPTCHLPAIEGQVSHFVEGPATGTMRPSVKKPAAVSYRCENDHVWTRNL